MTFQLLHHPAHAAQLLGAAQWISIPAHPVQCILHLLFDTIPRRLIFYEEAMPMTSNDQEIGS